MVGEKQKRIWEKENERSDAKYVLEERLERE